MKHLFVKKTLRSALMERARTEVITELIEQIADCVEDISCEVYSDMLHDNSYLSDNPTPKDGFILADSEWSVSAHDCFCEIMLDRIADAIETSKRKAIREIESYWAKPTEEEL